MSEFNTTAAAEKLIKKVKNNESKEESHAVRYTDYSNDVVEAISALGLGLLEEEEDDGVALSLDCGGRSRKTIQGQWVVYSKKRNEMRIVGDSEFKKKYSIIEPKSK